MNEVKNGKPIGWFSRRHQTSVEHILAQASHKTKAQRRAEAVTRNAASHATARICGHVHGVTIVCPVEVPR